MNKKPKDFYVYLHRRVTDGKVFYVGKGYGKRAFEITRGRNKYWHNIVNKHGLIVEIVETGYQNWYAIEREIQLIEFYGRENLCNLTDGGEGNLGWNPSEETKAKWKDQRTGYGNHRFGKKNELSHMFGRKASEETKKKMSDAKKGENHPMFGKFGKDHQCFGIKFSEESRRKVSESKIGIKNHNFGRFGSDNKSSKKIVCIEENIIFDSIKIAANWISEKRKKKTRPCHLSSACKGKLKTAYGYTWKYLLDVS